MKRNYTWIFSGIGVLIISLIINAIKENKQPKIVKNETYNIEYPKEQPKNPIIIIGQPNDHQIPKTPPVITEDFNKYINPSLLNSVNSTEVSVTILDENNDISQPISSDIAKIYSKKGKNGNIGLLMKSFIHKPEFHELFEGNSDIIKKLKLIEHTDFLALGKISSSFRSGTLVNGTNVCTASLEMSIISTSEKRIVNSFNISNVNGNGVTEDQAREEAFQKLMNIYFTDYSSL
jgi:hypothetical protein